MLNEEKRIIQSTNVKKFLSRYRIEMKELGSNLVMKCPFHEDRKPSFAIAFKGKRKGQFICYSGNCAVSGNLITFISMIEDITRSDAKEILEEEINLKQVYSLKKIRNKLKSVEKEYSKKKKKTKIKKVKFNHTNGISPEEQIIKLSNYLTKVRRYRSAETIKEIVKEFEIKIVNHKWIGECVCVPIYFRGRLRSFYYESLEDRSLKRYVEGSKVVSRCLFNLEEKEYHNLILTEGIWDAIKVWSCGYENVSSCFNASLSKYQVDCLNKYADVVTLFFDGDDAGRNGSEKARRELEPVNDVVIIKTPRLLDPGEMQRNEIRRKLQKIEGRGVYTK